MKTEQFSEHFRVEYHPNGIFVMRMDNFTRQTIDTWLEFRQTQDKLAATEKRPIAALLDVSQAGYPTPYLLKATLDKRQSTPKGLQEFVAVLLGGHLFINVFIGFMRRVPKRETSTMRPFRREEEPQALAWLAECLKHKV